MGPITLFDKSFLQTLSTDESVWFDNYFYPVIAPLFYIETLADLEKPPREGKTAEEEVGIIAAKTPQMSGGPCYFHHELCVQDLLGNHVPLTGQIPIAGMRMVVKEGKLGAVAEVSPEAKAFQRWQRGEFFRVEREYARAWRAQLSRIDLTRIEKAMKASGITAKSCKTIEDVLRLADETIRGLTKSTGRFDALLQVLEVPSEAQREIKDRWKAVKHPPLNMFAPYAAHVLRVELFFRMGLGSGHIASTRPSHRVDMAYLFYLPFCQIFVSNDHLHRKYAPMFMRNDQEFVWGHGLKPELAALNTHFDALAPETKAKGVFRFARRLPEIELQLIRGLYNRHTPKLLEPEERIDPSKWSKEMHEKIVADAKSWEEAPETGKKEATATAEMESLIIKRTVSKQKGRWVQIVE